MAYNKLMKHTMNLGGGAMGLGVTTTILGEMGQSEMAGKIGRMGATGLGIYGVAGYGMMAINAINKGQKKLKFKNQFNI